jgi:long-chain acyl-CoA synthetase
MATPSPEPLIVGGGVERTRRNLLERAARGATGLAGLGVGPGDAVALLLRNDLVMLEASIAANHIGAYAVPINWMLTPQEAGYLVDDARARVMVAHADLLARVQTHIPPDVRIVVVATGDQQGREPAPAAGTTWEELVANSDACLSAPPAQRSSIIYTSGTTGRPKGVRRAAPNAEQAERLNRLRASVYGLEPGLRTAVAGPLYHIATNSFAIRAAMIGDLVILMPRFDPERLLELIATHRLTTLFMVPMMFIRLLHLPPAVRARYDISSLRHVVHGGAPCPAHVKRAMIEWWGPIISETYGATELGSVTSCSSAEWLARPGTVGRPVDGATVRILDEDGVEAPCGQAGEVYASVDAYPAFDYQNRPGELDAIRRGSLVTTGDIGCVDADGYLYLRDRKREVIIFGGANVYPAEVEEALLQLEAVRDCAVIGTPDDTYGELVHALVVSDGSLTEAEIRQRLRKRLAAYKMPARVEFRPSLPRDDAGKLRRAELRAPYWRERQQAI